MRAPRTRLTWTPNVRQESTSIARAEVRRQTAPAALQENCHPLALPAVSRRRARPIQRRRRAVSLACVTQDIRGRMVGHVKLAALGRTRTRLAPAHALHARPASISLPLLCNLSPLLLGSSHAIRFARSTDGKLTRGHHGRVLLARRQRRRLRLRVQRWLHGPEWRDMHGVSGGQVQGGAGSRIVQQLPLGYNLETHARTIDCDDADGYLALVRIPWATRLP